MVDTTDKRFMVFDGKSQMSDRPTLRNMEEEQLTQLLGLTCGMTVPSSSERSQEFIVFIQSNQSVHHSRDTDSGDTFDGFSVAFPVILFETSIG